VIKITKTARKVISCYETGISPFTKFAKFLDILLRKENNKRNKKPVDTVDKLRKSSFCVRPHSISMRIGHTNIRIIQIMSTRLVELLMYVIKKPIEWNDQA